MLGSIKFSSNCVSKKIFEFTLQKISKVLCKQDFIKHKRDTNVLTIQYKCKCLKYN